MDILPAPYHREPELNALRDSVRRFVERELIPLEAELKHHPRLDKVQKAAVRERARKAGLWMLDIPESLGGQGHWKPCRSSGKRWPARPY